MNEKPNKDMKEWYEKYDRDTNPPPGVKCPNHACEERFVWGWCTDELRNPKTGDFAPSYEVALDKQGKSMEDCPYVKKEGTEASKARDKWEARLGMRLQIWKCPKCGVVLAICVGDYFGAFIYNHPDWLDKDGKPIDWEQDENAYPGD